MSSSPDDHVTSASEDPISSPVSTDPIQNRLGSPSYRNPAASSPRRKAKNCARVPYCMRFRGLMLIIGLVTVFILFDWWMLYRILHPHSSKIKLNLVSHAIVEEDPGEVEGDQKIMFGRLLTVAAHALAEGENKPEPKGLWEEPIALPSSWKPCADQRDWEPSEGNNGYVMVTANGGLNQQRVAVCNAVAVARLLNSTLVIPKFMYSSVWRDVRRSISSIT